MSVRSDRSSRPGLSAAAIALADTPSSGDKAARFANVFHDIPMAAMVGNLATSMTTAAVAGMALPVTINNRVAAGTCYVCCPSVAYGDYAREELGAMGLPSPLRGLGEALLRLGAPLVQAAGLDDQVQPNNWLLATNPLPPITAAQLSEMTRRLAADWPGRAILWRSLNEIGDAPAIRIFRAEGYRMLPARQVFLFDCRDEPPAIGRDERRDRALLEASGLTIVSSSDFAAGDFDRAAALYGLLYLEKYTRLNPRYSARFLSAMHRASLLEFQGLRAADGRLCAVIAYFDRGDVMTAPVVGYDTAQPQEAGLYRMAMALALQRARGRAMLFNMSGGAPSFKRNRGALPAIEYTAVYDRGLAVNRRLACGLLRWMLTHLGLPFVRRAAG